MKLKRNYPAVLIALVAAVTCLAEFKQIHTDLISRRILPKTIVEFRVEKDKMSCQSSKIQIQYSDFDELLFFFESEVSYEKQRN